MMNVIVSTPRYYCVAYIRQFVEDNYKAASRNVQNKAYQFFCAMDTDRNGTVDYSEFRRFFHSEGFRHHEERKRNLFMKLDKNGDHGLNFMEVMTFYYILKSGIPYYFCKNCNHCRHRQVCIYFGNFSPFI